MNMQSEIALALVFIAGGLAATQSAVNTQLGKLLGSPFQASFVSFTIGAAALFVVLLITREEVPGFSRLGNVPPVYLMGGLCGAVLVTVIIIFLPRVGVLNVLVFALAGQILVSIVIDHNGWLGVSPRPIDWARVIGLLLVFAGVVVLNRRQIM
jgi:transporter family-2 protein